MWTTVAEGVSTHRDLVFVEQGGFVASLVFDDLHLEHLPTRRSFRVSIVGVERIEPQVSEGREGLALQVAGNEIVLDDVSADFARELARRVVPLLPGVATPLEVSEQALHDEPTRFHAQVVRVRAQHAAAFEGSRLAGAWLSVPRSVAARPAGGLVDVTGLFMSDPEKHRAWRGPYGYGHMGMSAACLLAYRYEPVSVTSPCT